MGMNANGSVGADHNNIKERSIRGGTVTLTTQAISYGIMVVSTAILARLLTPEDYGIVAMVTSLTGFVSLFRDFGLSGATIQSRGISHDQISALFWINASLGILIMLIIMAAAPVIAWFYHKPQLVLVTIGLSFTSFFSSLGTQHLALLNRQMRFKAIALVQLSALLVGFLTAVIVALSGGIYWALVANNVVNAIWSSVGLWIVSDFRPSKPRRGTGIRQFLRFGASIAGFDFFYYFHDNMDQILIGRVWGPQQLGLYSKAYSLLMLPLANLRFPLQKVAFPAMSRLSNDAERYRSYFVQYCSLLAFASMPVVSVLFVCAENIIRLFLGNRWLGATELFRILALAGFIQSVASLRYTVLTSSGHGKRLIRLGFFITLATVTSFICGLPWGAKGVAVAYCIIEYLILHPSLIYAVKDTPVRPIDFYLSAAKPGLASIAMCFIYMLTLGQLRQTSDILLLAISLPFCLIIYLAIFYILPRGRKTLAVYWSYLSVILRKPA